MTGRYGDLPPFFMSGLQPPAPHAADAPFFLRFGEGVSPASTTLGGDAAAALARAFGAISLVSAGPPGAAGGGGAAADAAGWAVASGAGAAACSFPL
jgi:hypothetical protein